MIVVASSNGEIGLEAAWDVLANGGSALDAVEAGTRVVEDNPDDHTVGFGGYPNLLGEVELDASIMDGDTRQAGAVGGLRGYRAAITVARAVLERLPHALIVGEGAARLAADMGLEPEDLLTAEARKVWEDGLGGKLESGSIGARMLEAVRAMTSDPERAADAGTVNFIAVDGAGRLASAVSTSGWAWKYPGRVGDSPIIGAGNYCDARFGAATCTGFGELAMRSSTARTIVAKIERGENVEDAGVAAFADVATLGEPPERAILHAIAVDRNGNHAGVTTRAQGADYVVRTEDGVERHPRTVVSIAPA